MTPTKVRAFRIPESTWAKVEAIAAREGTTLTAIIVTALEQYAKEGEGDE